MSFVADEFNASPFREAAVLAAFTPAALGRKAESELPPVHHMVAPFAPLDPVLSSWLTVAGATLGMVANSPMLTVTALALGLVWKMGYGAVANVHDLVADFRHHSQVAKGIESLKTIISDFGPQSPAFVHEARTNPAVAALAKPAMIAVQPETQYVF